MESVGSNFGDAARCPLCGADNVCAMVQAQRSGEPAGTCWCVQASFSAELIARLPEAARGQACICAACVERSGPPD